MKYLNPFDYYLELKNIRKYVSTDYIPKRGVIPSKTQPKYKQKKKE
ncbi:hypothetical protein [Capnocytophaga stomatis]|uniref:Uncharacterized protein n=1 Tax=Capnocytophaga stomatis TaxID=1848904 RepID=A0ABW8Q8D3_9FLAO